jgi:hypothetical protein
LTPPLRDGQWNIEKSNQWYASQPPILGCNFLPSTAVNDVEMWQNSTFDAATIDRELGWAEQWGINSVRVFLNYVVWEAEAETFKKNFATFLDLCEKHKIRVMPIPFDDCNFAGRNAAVGKQAEPIPGVHNSQWVASPPQQILFDENNHLKLKAYLQDIIGTFGQDKRILVWDLYNEPGNSRAGDKYIDFIRNVFAWAREMKPSQPLTIGAWDNFFNQRSRLFFEESDVISYHGYDNVNGVKAKIDLCRSYGRPVLCTEWLLRQSGNSPKTLLPLFQKYKIGIYQWGLVAGRTQTYFHWGSKAGTLEPTVWQHDLIRKDGTPHDIREFALYRNFAAGNDIEKLLRSPEHLGLTVIVATSETHPLAWRYTETEPSADWTQLDFNDSAWQLGNAPFGVEEQPNRFPKTQWKSQVIWLRHTFELDEAALSKIKHLELSVHFDESPAIYLNGEEIAKLNGYNTDYQSIPLHDNVLKHLRAGKNVLSIKATQTYGGQFIDAGIFGW